MRNVERYRKPVAVNKNVAQPARIGDSSPPAALPASASHRLSVLGEMTGGIAHDLRNILSVIEASLRLIESNLDDPNKVRTFVSGASEGVARGVTLTSQLLTFAQQGDINRSVADVNALLKDLELFLKYGAGPSVRVVLELSSAVPRCFLNASRFSTAVLNLVVNARDAMSTDAVGEVRIGTSHVHTAPAGEGGASFVRVGVQDNGSGMPDDIVRRAFDPFFTTKGIKGTGLGVPQVDAFMRQVGGHMKISSQKGRGTTVELFFPAVETEHSRRRVNTAAIPNALLVTRSENGVRPHLHANDSMQASQPAAMS